MKKSITLYLIAISYALFFSQSVSAQNFLWGRSGGSQESTSGSDDETVRDIAIDRNGNVYILCRVKTSGLNISKQPITGYGWTDVMLASFTSKGDLRWVKMIGNGDSDNAYWLGTDAKDGVYFSALLDKSNNPSNIDKDATSPKNLQRNIIVKYDTSGKYQWYRHPEADTLTNIVSNSYTGIWAMDVAPSGTVYCLMQLFPGAYAGGAITVSDTGTYLLKYSSTGALSFSKPELKISGVSGSSVAMTVDEANNRFYLSGYDAYNNGEVWMNGSRLTPRCVYIGCFKLDGSHLWHKEGTGASANFFSRVAIDGMGNIYQAGQGSSGLVFSGYTFNTGTGSSRPLIVKMDKNGNLLWAKAANTGTTSGAAAVAVRNKDEVVLVGTFNKTIEWPGYSGSLATGSYDLFLTRFQTWNGDVLGMDLVKSDVGYTEHPRCMASDGNGHVYIGGDFTQKMYVNYKDTLANNPGGGTTDWFVVKYGDMWPASVSTANSNSNVSIYPNPATEQVTVSGITEGTTIRITNMLGQQVLKVVSKGDSEVVNTSGMTPGSYVLQLINNDGGRESYRIEKR